MQRTEQRRDKLRRLVKKAGAEALLVTNEANVTYLTGFTGDSSYLLLMKSGELLLTDGRYTTQLEDECPGLDLAVRGPGSSVADLTAKEVKKAKLTSIAIESDTVTMSLFGSFTEGMPQVEWVKTSQLVESLREIKDKEEILAIREAIRLAERAFGVVKASVRPERTEREIAHELEQQIRLFGGDCCAFDPIVAVGAWAALPHATPGDRRIRDDDFVLIDWGAKGDLYLSDLTRILVTGKISPKLERIYGVVKKAQQKAIDTIRPGVAMKEVDAAARGVITKAGHGKHFNHGLGHGIGLEIHEQPRLAANIERPLKAGMVVTVEPGIYLPHWGGVRLEDDVLVTRDGHEVLSNVPKELADCVVG